MPNIMEIPAYNNSVLKNIITATKKSLEARKGYSVCELSYVDDESLIDTLSFARFKTRTTYLMARCEAKEPITFVHFTTKKNAESIKVNGFRIQTEENGNESDFYNALCCFRVDAMSRAFKTDEIDTAVVFEYSGEYFTCIRQEDSNSNIGYQIIEDLSGVTDITPISYDSFIKMKSSIIIDPDCIMLHHGLPTSLSYLLNGLKYEDISEYLPKIYEEMVNGDNKETNEFNL